MKQPTTEERLQKLFEYVASQRKEISGLREAFHSVSLELVATNMALIEKGVLTGEELKRAATAVTGIADQEMERLANEEKQGDDR